MDVRYTVCGALLLALGFSACAAPPLKAAKDGAAPFAGVWVVDWCEKSSPKSTCGGFRAYLVQDGTHICGTHYGADERSNRLDEGEPRSIVGTVVDATAVLTVTSARNHGIYLVTAKREDDALAWKRVSTVKDGSNGEPALISDDDRLRGSRSADDLEYLKTVTKDCATKGLDDGKTG